MMSKLKLGAASFNEDLGHDAELLNGNIMTPLSATESSHHSAGISGPPFPAVDNKAPILKRH